MNKEGRWSIVIHKLVMTSTASLGCHGDYLQEQEEWWSKESKFKCVCVYINYLKTICSMKSLKKKLYQGKPIHDKYVLIIIKKFPFSTHKVNFWGKTKWMEIECNNIFITTGNG